MIDFPGERCEVKKFPGFTEGIVKILLGILNRAKEWNPGLISSTSGLVNHIGLCYEIVLLSRD